MKHILLVLVFASASAFATSSKENALFSAKVKFDQKVHQLKVLHEQDLIKINGKKDFSFFASAADIAGLIKTNDVGSCVEFVYQGSATREQAVAACAGVYSLECVQFVYQGPANREESARACAGVTDMSCVEFMYKGASNREESARACAYGGSAPAPIPSTPDGC